MDWLPKDLPSFIWGAVVAGAVAVLAAIATGFLKKAGEDVYSKTKEKFFPAPPEPVKVSGKFVPTAYAPGTCSWVPGDRLYEFEEKNYSYYPHPETGAKCFRVVSLGGSATREEYLMVMPDAKRVTT